jgi:rhombotail lipoprotein
VRCHIPLGCLALAMIAAPACVPMQRQLESNALEYLYPSGAPAAPSAEVKIALPARVGIAFAPAPVGRQETFTEGQKQALSTKIADAFEGRPSIGSVQAIPSTYLKAGGGFADLDRVAAAFGIDLIVLVSYDQVQFSDPGKASIAYWTIVGAYFVKGEKNETSTMLDAAVFDIASRTMLFNASGRSGVSGRATPIAADRALRERSATGFEGATADLITNLDTALDAFQEQAKSGTIRGPGTPAVAFVDERGQPAVSGGGSGGGAAGLGEIAAAAVLAAAALAASRARRS